jgi:hypothetical protein
MSFLNLEQLPFVGMSYEFVGETQGAAFSAYIVKAKPGQARHYTRIRTSKSRSRLKAAPRSRSAIKPAK